MTLDVLTVQTSQTGTRASRPKGERSWRSHFYECELTWQMDPEPTDMALLLPRLAFLLRSRPELRDMPMASQLCEGQLWGV